MKQVSYNMSELEKFTEFNVANTLKNFSSQQIYFNKLTVFTKEAKNYLKGYTPLVVTSSESDCNNFLNDIQRIIRMLLSLGMNDMVMELEKLGDAAFNKDTKILEDGLLKFHCEMDILTNRILMASIEEDVNQADKQKEGKDGKELKGVGMNNRNYERHMLIAEILMKIGVDEVTAHQDSRKIEHDISEKSFTCIKKYYKNHVCTP